MPSCIKKGKYKMKKVHIAIRFTDPILGMSPSNPNIYMDYIAANSPTPEYNDEELDALPSADVLEEEGASEPLTVTVFPRTRDNKPCFYDYQIRGFFKDSCGLLSYVRGVDENGKKTKKKAGTISGKTTAYKKVIDGNVFVSPRKIPIEFDGDMTLCQRPLRAMTPMGERVALACSEQIPEGAKIAFDVTLYNDEDVDLLAEWMAYGKDHGMGQWRNSGKGRFLVEEFIVTDVKDGVKPYFTIQHA